MNGKNKAKCESCKAPYEPWKFKSCEETCKISQCKKCVIKFFNKNDDIKDCISCYESIPQKDFNEFLKINA